MRPGLASLFDKSVRQPTSITVFGWTLLTVPARHQQRLARDPARVVGRKEHRRARDVVRLRDASERGLRLYGLAKIAVLDSRGVLPLREHQPRINRVHANPAWPEFLG